MPVTSGNISTASFYVQAQKTAIQGNLTFTASATGFSTANALVHVLASGFVIQGVPASFNTTVSTTDTTLWIYPAALDSSLNLYQIQKLIPVMTNTQVEVLTMIFSASYEAGERRVDLYLALYSNRPFPSARG